MCIKESQRRSIFYDHMKYKHSNTYYDLKATYKCDLCDNELTSGELWETYETETQETNLCDNESTNWNIFVRHMKPKQSGNKCECDLCEN